MTARKTTTDVPYTAEQMFDLVADVKRYPEFLPWCNALRIVKSDVANGQGTMTADMVVAYKVFRERFRSQVSLNRSEQEIEAAYLDGPFRNLENHWRFEDKPEGGSRIYFEIDFEFKNFLLQATAQAVFDKAFGRMSDAFVERAHEVYGD
ncbi:type II toxin-antitoxin system RatA family toxin [Hyphococcus lacteus]|uniref:Type II toxin-antitoxin system RatA family toxin n=1 Tax=Hyphococcus lacteus TaxID=3143536 RepID=A0ABV3Z5S5_9PROT